MSIFQIAVDEKDEGGALRFVPREFANDLVTAKQRGEELVAAGRAVLIEGLHGGVCPVDGWYWAHDANHFDARGAWVYTRTPFAVRPHQEN